ncbi:uncharacterized protein LOC142984253 isoform X2 [Anticarsia gemmatalis]|uniref:uncharacterized protein LOC142984253 isoform X2 n=1 Tax=Anticarsia gemmatalis TaxID=129554 RepID=UPI003F759A73
MRSVAVTTSLALTLIAHAHTTTAGNWLESTTEGGESGDPWRPVVGEAGAAPPGATLLPAGASGRRALNLVDNIRRQLMRDNYDYDDRQTPEPTTPSQNTEALSPRPRLTRAPSTTTTTTQRGARTTQMTHNIEDTTLTRPPRNRTHVFRSIDDDYGSLGNGHKLAQAKPRPFERNVSQTDLLYYVDDGRLTPNNDHSDEELLRDHSKPGEDDNSIKQDARRHLGPTRRRRRSRHRKRLYALGNDRKIKKHTKSTRNYKYWDQHVSQTIYRRHDDHDDFNDRQREPRAEHHEKKYSVRDSQTSNNNEKVKISDTLLHTSTEENDKQQTDKYDEDASAHHTSARKIQISNTISNVLPDYLEPRNDESHPKQGDKQGLPKTYNKYDDVNEKKSESIHKSSDHNVNDEPEDMDENKHYRRRLTNTERQPSNEYRNEQRDSHRGHGDQRDVPSDYTHQPTRDQPHDEKLRLRYNKHAIHQETEGGEKLGDLSDVHLADTVRDEDKDKLDEGGADEQRTAQDDLDQYKQYVQQVRNSNVKYKLLKVKSAGKSRRAGAGDAGGARRFLQERGAEGVALISLDAAPFPQFRLPRERRQYMHEGRDPRPPLAEHLPAHHHHHHHKRPVPTHSNHSV